MNVQLLLQVFLSVVSILSYFIILAVVRSATRGFGLHHKYLEKRTIYINKFFAGLLFLILIVILAIVWGIDIGGVFIFASAFLTVVGVAFFASWSILSNLTSGVIIFFEFPYRIGDKIEILEGDNSINGEIVDMTLFHVQIEDEDGNNVFYPNNLIFQKPVLKPKS